MTRVSIALAVMLLLALCVPADAAARRQQRRRRAVSTGRPVFVIDPKKPNFGLPFRVTSVVALNITIDGAEMGQIRVGLFGEEVPKTVENFRALALGTKGFGYVGSSFHRLVRGYILQGGDFTNGDGTGGYAIYGKGRFEDENFIIPHGERVVSMANAGKNNNGAQFFISLNNQNRFLNGKHVAFGIVLAGYKLVKQIERLGKTNSTTNRLITDVRINAASVVTDLELHTGALTTDHVANEDGTEGPKKVAWRRRRQQRRPAQRRQQARGQRRQTRRGGYNQQRRQQYRRRGY